MNDKRVTNDTRAAKPVVMVVDDEEIVTQSLSSLLELEADYEVVEFQSPLSAIDYLKKAQVDIVISNFLMPELNGLKFLSEVKRIHPDTPRIILTGYADKQNAIKAINEVGIYHYIEKPWDNDDILLVIHNCLENKSLKSLLKEKVHVLDEVSKERQQLLESTLCS